jgi:hypothetical protein
VSDDAVVARTVLQFGAEGRSPTTLEANKVTPGVVRKLKALNLVVELKAVTEAVAVSSER